jgi:hypothetical protein
VGPAHAAAGGKVNVNATTHLQVVPKLRMNIAVPSLPHIPSWRVQEQLYVLSLPYFCPRYLSARRPNLLQRAHLNCYTTAYTDLDGRVRVQSDMLGQCRMTMESAEAGASNMCVACRGNCW